MRSFAITFVALLGGASLASAQLSGPIMPDVREAPVMGVPEQADNPLLVIPDSEEPGRASVAPESLVVEQDPPEKKAAPEPVQPPKEAGPAKTSPPAVTDPHAVSTTEHGKESKPSRWLTECCECDNRCWGSVEYLLWQVENGPLPVPVLSPDPSIGVNNVFNPTSFVVALGNGADLQFGSSSGVRATVGSWLNGPRTLGWEVSGFWLEQGSFSFSAQTFNATFDLFVPFINAQTGLQTAIGTNNFLLEARSELWGGEGNGLWNMARGPRGSLDLLAGARYLNLNEDLRIQTIDVPVGSFNTDDLFITRNDFYGGQVGVRSTMQYGRLSLAVTGKLAFGVTQSEVDVAGITVFPDGSTLSGGIFAQPTNIGGYSKDMFAVVPELQVMFRVTLGQRSSVFVGYTFLYISDVLRPGDQLDAYINTSQFTGNIADLVGPARPQVPLTETDFWAQGVSFGVELRY